MNVTPSHQWISSILPQTFSIYHVDLVVFGTVSVAQRVAETVEGEKTSKKERGGKNVDEEKGTKGLGLAEGERHNGKVRGREEGERHNGR